MRQIVLFALLLCCAGGCLHTGPLAPTAVPAPTPTPTPAPAAAPGWRMIAPGLAQRTYIPGENRLAALVALRIDPSQYTFRAHYRPADPLTLAQWRTALPEAVAIVNANFFDPEFRLLGLLVSDGTVYGQPYVGRGGMFAVQDGVPSVRSNTRQPYHGEPLEQAVQAFPMLVLDGEQAFTDARQTRPARRTVVGQDAQGRIVLMATPGIGLGLYDLSAYLPTTDLNLVNAFNLDGGGSTMMWIAPSDYTLRSFDPVPAVLAVYSR